MSTITLTIRAIRQPAEGRNSGAIKGDGDQWIGCWSDKLQIFEVGKTYEVETTEKKSGGVTYVNVKSAKEVKPVRVVTSQQTAQRSAAPQPSGNSGSLPPRSPTHPSDSKRMFICSLMNAFIQAGVVHAEAKSMVMAIREIERAYDHTLAGDDAVIQGQKAAR